MSLPESSKRRGSLSERQLRKPLNRDGSHEIIRKFLRENPKKFASRVNASLVNRKEMQIIIMTHSIYLRKLVEIKFLKEAAQKALNFYPILKKETL